ncbi:hypothetical protein EDD15DRAFT_2200452 [Pisolithus albus]|nr:hypothetical protein EDD15DRAFT_2200452 [Pisolithus albus]
MQAFPSLQTQRYPQSPPSSLEPARKTETPSDDETRAGRTRKVRQQVCQHMHRLSEGGTTGGDIVNEHLTHLSAYRSAGVGVSPLGTGGRKPAIRRPRWRNKQAGKIVPRLNALPYIADAGITVCSYPHERSEGTPRVYGLNTR